MNGTARCMSTGWTPFLIGCALLALTIPARGQEDAAETVRAALTQWRDDFNAGEIEGLCDIFAPDLVVTYRGTPDRGYAAFCRQLEMAVADPNSICATTSRSRRSSRRATWSWRARYGD